RPLRRPAPELEDVQAPNVAQDPKIPFRDLPRAPSGVGRVQLGAVVPLVLIAVAVPVVAVLQGVNGRLGRLWHSAHARSEPEQATWLLGAGATIFDHAP